MSERSLSLGAIEAYLHCPLFYRFSFEDKIPYGKNIGDLVLNVSKLATSTWLSSLGKGLSYPKARDRVGSRIKLLIKKSGGGFDDYPLVHAHVMSILIALSKIFRSERDTIVGGGTRTSMVVNNTLIENPIEGIFIKHGCTQTKKRKQLVVLQIVGDSSKRSSVYVPKIRLVLARHTINTTLSGFDLDPHLTTIFIPSFTRRVVSLRVGSYSEVRHLLAAITKQIEKGVFVPLDNPLVCKICPYNNICSTEYCSR